ncbi:MAG: hypothetical protein M0Z54_00170 [Thermaerobacter sp.]|nr:hypothetical protein [Thermaerobacter sp.]
MLGLTSLDGILMFALATVGVMLFIGVPFIDRHKERRLLKRPVMLGILLVGFVFFGYFTANGVYTQKRLVAADPMAIYTSSCATSHALGPLGNQTGVVKLPDGQCIYPPPLTNVGSILSAFEIRQQLVQPEGGMP